MPSPNLDKVKKAAKVLTGMEVRFPETIDLNDSKILRKIRSCLGEVCVKVQRSHNPEVLNAIYTIRRECQLLDFSVPEYIIKYFVDLISRCGHADSYRDAIARTYLYSYEDAIAIIKLFIKNEDIDRFGLIRKITETEKIGTLLTNIYLADWISGAIPKELQLKEVLHEYLYDYPERRLKVLGQEGEAEQKDFIERIQYNYWRNDNKKNFYASIRRNIPLFSKGLLSKITDEIPEINILISTSSVSLSKEELQQKEAAILHKMFKISPVPLAIILRSELNTWKADELKENTLNFYLKVYKDFPEVIKIVEILRQNEEFQIPDEEKTNCIKCLNENVGHSFTEISEEDIVSYMLSDKSIVESIQSMMYNISLKESVQESLQSIYQAYEKIDPMISFAIQQAFQTQICRNEQLEMQVKNFEQKCETQQKEIDEVKQKVSKVEKFMEDFIALKLNTSSATVSSMLFKR